MTGPKFVATSVRHVWASAAIVAIMLVVAGCELPGAEPPAPPATPTPAASPAVGTRAEERAVATPVPTPTPPSTEKTIRTSACVTGSGMMRQAAIDSARWTLDGTHILFTYGAEVWAVAADGSRLWRVAQAWGEIDAGPGHSFTFGGMTSFDVTRDGQQVVYATCRYPPPDVPRGTQSPGEWAFRFDYELAVVGSDGQAPRRLTHHPAFDNYPAWSPDGTRVAFASDRDEDPWLGLYLMVADGADGADVRRLGPDLGVSVLTPAWSPDGRALAVNGWRQEGGSGLYVVPADGTGIVWLADAESGGSWSPDGRRLAFAQPEGDEAALYTIAADGADARRVTTVPRWQITVPRWKAGYRDQAWIHTVAWSPDGAQLLYPCGERQFCVVTLDGEQVGATPLIGDHAVWSPDGQRIAVARRLDAYPALHSAGLILYSAAPDGSDVRPLVLAEATRSSSLVGKIEAARLIAAQVRDEDPAASRAACAGGFVVPAPEANPGLVSDCETLLAARAALFGGRLVNWGSGSLLALWMGVTITGTPPRVTGLDLDYEDLRGSIPPELANLTQLRHLYLARNRLTGCIPVGLKRVPDNDLGLLGLPDCEAGS